MHLLMSRKITTALEEWVDSDEYKVMMIDVFRNIGKTYSVRKFSRRRFGSHFLEVNIQDDVGNRRIFDSDLDVDTVIMTMSARFRDFEFVPGETLIFLDEI